MRVNICHTCVSAMSSEKARRTHRRQAVYLRSLRHLQAVRAKILIEPISRRGMRFECAFCGLYFTQAKRWPVELVDIDTGLVLDLLNANLPDGPNRVDHAMRPLWEASDTPGAHRFAGHHFAWDNTNSTWELVD